MRKIKGEKDSLKSKYCSRHGAPEVTKKRDGMCNLHCMCACVCLHVCMEVQVSHIICVHSDNHANILQYVLRQGDSLN